MWPTVTSTASACLWNNSNTVGCFVPSPPTSANASSITTSSSLVTQRTYATVANAIGNTTIRLIAVLPIATYRVTAPNPAAGRLATHEAKIFPNTLKSTFLAPPARPTPTTAPTNVWVVDTGTARNGIENTRIVVAAPNSAANPRVGVISVILWPIVSITLQPHVTTPIAIPAEPSSTNQSGTSTFPANSPGVEFSNS